MWTQQNSAQHDIPGIQQIQDVMRERQNFIIIDPSISFLSLIQDGFQSRKEKFKSGPVTNTVRQTQLKITTIMTTPSFRAANDPIWAMGGSQGTCWEPMQAHFGGGVCLSCDPVAKQSHFSLKGQKTTNHRSDCGDHCPSKQHSQ